MNSPSEMPWIRTELGHFRGSGRHLTSLFPMAFSVLRRANSGDNVPRAACQPFGNLGRRQAQTVIACHLAVQRGRIPGRAQDVDVGRSILDSASAPIMRLGCPEWTPTCPAPFEHAERLASALRAQYSRRSRRLKRRDKFHINTAKFSQSILQVLEVEPYRRVHVPTRHVVIIAQALYS